MNVVLYVIDALRADHVSCYGYSRPTTPNLDALAAEGVLFSKCFTPATWTRPVAASLLTGVYPGVHGVHTLQDTLSEALPTLPELLSRAGYHTAAFSAVGNVSPVLGFSRGFDTYHALYRSEKLLAFRKAASSKDHRLRELGGEELVLPLAEDVNEAFFEWAVTRPAVPFFSFMWVLDAHAPYDPPLAFRRFGAGRTAVPAGTTHLLRSARTQEEVRPLVDLYDDEVLHVDHCLGELVDYLKASGLFADTLLIVTSDHGEAFHEHGATGHGQMPYDELLRVPLVMKLPGPMKGARRVDSLLWLGDVMPTILDLVGVELPRTQGASVMPLIRGESAAIHEQVFSETVQWGGLLGSRQWKSVRSLRWKYITTQCAGSRGARSSRGGGLKVLPSKDLIWWLKNRIWGLVRHPLYYARRLRESTPVMLFDVAADPGETINLATERTDVVSETASVLRDWADDNRTWSLELGDALASRLSLDEETELREHLKALGYID